MTTIAEFKDRIQTATAQKTPLCIQGGGTKTWYGQQPVGNILNTRSHAGIIDYDPSELVITARTGTPLSEVQTALAAKQQMLAFEPPSFGEHATLGGVVATALAGPRRAYVGGVRDFVLGAVLMNGQGERLAFGGQVMKNVAGYDVTRLLTGSLGCLGLLLEVSIKVLPVPRSEITVSLELSQAAALSKLNQWAGKPVPISASAWENGRLSIRLSGSEVATLAAKNQLGGEELRESDAAEYWASLREQQHAFFKNQPTLWRLSLPSTTPELDLGGQQLIEWSGAQRWLVGPLLDDHGMREKVAAVGGHATLFKTDEQKGAVFQALPSPLMLIHRRLKSAFDPAGIFNPGRLYPEL